jgi:hypothetical protein
MTERHKKNSDLFSIKDIVIFLAFINFKDTFTNYKNK